MVLLTTFLYLTIRISVAATADTAKTAIKAAMNDRTNVMSRLLYELNCKLPFGYCQELVEDILLTDGVMW